MKVSIKLRVDLFWSFTYCFTLTFIPENFSFSRSLFLKQVHHKSSSGIFSPIWRERDGETCNFFETLRNNFLNEARQLCVRRGHETKKLTGKTMSNHDEEGTIICSDHDMLTGLFLVKLSPVYAATWLLCFGFRIKESAFLYLVTHFQLFSIIFPPPLLPAASFSPFFSSCTSLSLFLSPLTCLIPSH